MTFKVFHAGFYLICVVTFTLILKLNRGVVLNDLVKNLILWGVIALILLSVFSSFSQRSTADVDITYAGEKR